MPITDTAAGWDRRIESWTKVRDAIEGEEQIKEKGSLYLPRPGGMKLRDYASYKTRASFYAVADRTLRGLVGLVFRVEPVITLPPALAGLSEAMSPEGYDSRQLIRESLRETLSIGRLGLLVDMPQTGSPNALPYIATWRAEEIFNWEEGIDPVSGVRMLTRVCAIEEPAIQDGEEVARIRELYLEDGVYHQRVWMQVTTQTSIRKTSVIGSMFFDGFDSFEAGPVLTPTMNGAPLPFIPFIFVNTFDLRPTTEKAPFLDLVNVNLAHYRNSADYEMALHMIGSPTPYAFGMKKEERPTTVGPSQIWHSSAKDVKVGMLEYTGQGVATLRNAMQDKEDRMAVLGARLVRSDNERDNVTAETTRLEAREETSVLMGGTETVELAFRKALQWAASFKGIDPGSVNVKLNRDFVDTRLSAGDLEALVSAWQAGAFSRRVLHSNLQRGEIMPADLTVEEMEAEVQKEMDIRAARELEKEPAE